MNEKNTFIKPTTANERLAWLEQQYQALQTQQITSGQLLRLFRERVLEMNQDQYARVVKISRKTLSDLEGDKPDKSIIAYNKAFRPLGLEMGLKPRQR